MNSLYLDCSSGISSDMVVSALIDLGADENKLKQIVLSISAECEVEIKNVEKCSVNAKLFDIKNDNKSHKHNHNHTHEIYNTINGSILNDSAKKIATEIYDVVIEAEANVHNKPKEEVHLHEVGSLESIISVCCVAFCIDNLKIDKVYCSTLSEGYGQIKCAHGIIPVPVPATSQIAKIHKLPMKIIDVQSELVTPTGAAIVATIVDEFKSPENMIIKNIGIGAGKKDFEHANILRAFLFEEETSSEHKDKITLIETSIDDSTPEELGYLLEKLFEIGVKDASYSPVFMKKNRPAYELKVMCDYAIEENAIKLIFKNSTAIGVRKRQAERVKMKRIETTVQTNWGEVKANKFVYDDIEKTCLEYESVKQIAEKNNCGIVDIYRNY